MSDDVELKPGEEVNETPSEEVGVKKPTPRKSAGRPPATEEQKEIQVKKARERSKKNNDLNRQRLKESLSIKEDIQEFKKLVMEKFGQLDSSSSKPKTEENNSSLPLKEMPPTNPEVKPPAPKPRQLTKEEKIRMALFGRF